MAARAEHLSLLWAGVGDAGQLVRMHAELFEPAWDAAFFERLLGHPGCTALLARAGDPLQTAGFVVGLLAADEAEIITLGVRKDWQRCGVGCRLVQALARAVKKAEARQLFLEVAAGNTAALALYRKLGFREHGRRAAYYQRPGATAEDAITLSLAL
jgi:ribosomal-protein-alanine N-acetyltransferase